MTNSNEPHLHKIVCTYCGDAPLNHRVSFFTSIMDVGMDRYMSKLAKHTPVFLLSIVDDFVGGVFEIFSLFKIARFSSDMDLANTLRSRVIWEEATRRGVKMEQAIFWKQPLDYYRANIKGQTFYFKSVPIRPELSRMNNSWDDKVVLKKELRKHNLPAPAFVELKCLSFSYLRNKDKVTEEIFSKLNKPIIVKPRVGSRGRHTVTNINTLEQFRHGVEVAKTLSPYLVVEEHLSGAVCRATFVRGELAGFYKAEAPSITGDGKHTVKELIEEKDRTRNVKVEKIIISKELQDHILRSGFTTEDVMPAGTVLQLTHRMGRLFGGKTKEMLGELHPSFLPILNKAAKMVNIPLIGFDCIVPDPTKDESSQRWGIIECNTLPFIDLHYYALEGTPKNIAGMIWEMWK
ncbi:MAG: hypothetical protein WCI76_02150 [bacterium]